MKTFKIEALVEHESADMIWDSDMVQPRFEAENGEEAIDFAIDYLVDVDGAYIDEIKNITFRAIEI